MQYTPQKSVEKQSFITVRIINIEYILFFCRIGLTPQSNVWIGAWWIGFIFGAIICFLLALPIIAYPSSLPGKKLYNDKY